MFGRCSKEGLIFIVIMKMCHCCSASKDQSTNVLWLRHVASPLLPNLFQIEFIAQLELKKVEQDLEEREELLEASRAVSFNFR